MTVEIEAGKFYRRRDGRVVGPMKPGPSGRYYPWSDGSMSYTAQGGWFYDGVNSGADLVEEVADPNETPQQAADRLLAEHQDAKLEPPFDLDAAKAHAANVDKADEQGKTQVSVQPGETPLDNKLGHRFLDVIREGMRSRAEGTTSPYSGHSLEHCLHATGWVQQDLSLALEKATGGRYRVPDPKQEAVEQQADEPAWKQDGGKARMDLIAPEFLFALATVLRFGAAKYAARNWEKGMSWGRVFGALMRHLWAWWGGVGPTTENFVFGVLDEETKMSHLWHAACCLMFLVAYEQRKIGTDDRSKAA